MIKIKLLAAKTSRKIIKLLRIRQSRQIAKTYLKFKDQTKSEDKYSHNNKNK